VKLKKIGAVLVVIGSLVIMASAALWLRNYFEENSAAEFSERVTTEFISWVYTPVENSDSGFDSILDIEFDFPDDTQPVERFIEIDEVMYIGVLSIPTLNLNLPINSTWSNAALKNTPCRYSGNIYDNTLVIGAHNYAAHFRNISNLLIGDQVIFLCAEGIEHLFEIVSLETVRPSSRDSVVYSDYDLTMFTCTFDGQERTVVRCVRAVE
jgi:sortase A